MDKIVRRVYIESIEYLFSNKKLFSGVAIIMVLLYHCNWSFSLLKIITYPGYLGVDIFFLFTGYGLCYSIAKHDTKSFLKRRILRIGPLFILMAVVVSYLRGTDNLIEWICNISTLSYYGLGGKFVDWYLSSLFLFYLSFPFVYKMMMKYKDTCFALFTLCTIIVLTILVFIPMDFNFGCALGRIPIFIVGIMCGIIGKKDVLNRILIIPYLVSIPVVIVLFYVNLIQRYVVFYFLAPYIILLISYVISKIFRNIIYLHKFCTILKLIGGFTLEIYVANIIVMTFLKYSSNPYSVCLYWILNVFMSICVVYLNKLITKAVKVD